MVLTVAVLIGSGPRRPTARGDAPRRLRGLLGLHAARAQRRPRTAWRGRFGASAMSSIASASSARVIGDVPPAPLHPADGEPRSRSTRTIYRARSRGLRLRAVGELGPLRHAGAPPSGSRSSITATSSSSALYVVPMALFERRIRMLERALLRACSSWSASGTRSTCSCRGAVRIATSPGSSSTRSPGGFWWPLVAGDGALGRRRAPHRTSSRASTRRARRSSRSSRSATARTRPTATSGRSRRSSRRRSSSRRCSSAGTTSLDVCAGLTLATVAFLLSSRVVRAEGRDRTARSLGAGLASAHGQSVAVAAQTAATSARTRKPTMARVANAPTAKLTVRQGCFSPR